jgi:putative thioredoxin
MSHPHLPIYNATLDTFDELVIQASHQRPVLVDLWADWCAPCVVVAPILEKVIAEFAGKVALAKIEVDDGDNMKIAGRYRVRGFPTILLFEDGEERGRFSSARPVHFVRDFIVQHSRIVLQSSAS